MKRTLAILSALAITGAASAAMASHPQWFGNVAQARFQAQAIASKASSLLAAARASRFPRRPARRAAVVSSLKKVKRSANRFLRQAAAKRPSLKAAFARIQARYNEAKSAFAWMRPNWAQRAQFASIAGNLASMHAALSAPPPRAPAPRYFGWKPYGKDVRPVVVNRPRPVIFTQPRPPVKAPPAKVTYKPYTVTYRPYGSSAPAAAPVTASTTVYTTPGVTVGWYRAY